MPGIDLHAHLAPLLDPDGPALAGVRVSGDGRLEVDGHRVGLPGLYAPEKLLEHLASCDLDEAIVSIPPPFFRQQLDAPAAAAWIHAANDGLLERLAGHHGLSGLAYLALEHPEVALAEYQRIREDPSWSGVVASAGGGSMSLADASLHPLWDALHADRRMLLLHPGTSPDARLEEFYLSNLLGNPVETAVAAAQLVFGDVLARWPDLRVLLVHCGGCVGSVVGRWERGVQTDRPGLAPLTEPPRLAVRRMFVDCLSHDRGVLDQAVEVFGADRIVLGSDWPFPMGVDDPRAMVAHRSPEFRAQVAVDNARAALGRIV